MLFYSLYLRFLNTQECEGKGRIIAYHKLRFENVRGSFMRTIFTCWTQMKQYYATREESNRFSQRVISTFLLCSIQYFSADRS